MRLVIKRNTDVMTPQTAKGHTQTDSSTDLCIIGFLRSFCSRDSKYQ